MADNPDEMLTVQQAADILALSPPEIRRLLASEVLPRFGTKNHPRLRYADVLTYRATVNRLRKEARERAASAERMLARAKAQSRIKAAERAATPQERAARQGLDKQMARQWSGHLLPDPDIVEMLRGIVG